jgi:hypothetical protein
VQDTEDNYRIIHFSGCSSEKKSEIKTTFQSIYNQILDLSKDKLTILLSLYNHINGEEILGITNYSISTETLFDALRETNGYIIYHHQLEHFLINEMGFDAKEAIELRKSWNKKVLVEKMKVITYKNYYKLVGLMPFEFTFNKII